MVVLAVMVVDRGGWVRKSSIFSVLSSPSLHFSAKHLKQIHFHID